VITGPAGNMWLAQHALTRRAQRGTDPGHNVVDGGHP
jgi:hypothetical protein